MSTEYEWMKSVLIGEDVDLLVADFAHIQLNDLGRSHDDHDAMLILEPMVGVVIVLNCIFIGIQTDESIGTWRLWDIFEYIFTALFVMEACFKIRHHTCKEYFCGPEYGWNLFDLTVVLLAFLDILLLTVPDDTVGNFTALRLIKLTRLARLVRIFRLRKLKELTLMVKGLFGGMLTLFWAVLLLFIFVYLIAIVMVTFVVITNKGKEPDTVFHMEVYPLFKTLDLSMMTVFRCLTGDCSTATGLPLILLLKDEYGAFFVIIWVGVTMFVTFGVYNLIMAIYLEGTLAAAKKQAQSAKAQKREAVWVAKTTRSLVAKFCRAQQQVHRGKELSGCNVHMCLEDSSENDLMDSTVEISKDTFLLVLQDPLYSTSWMTLTFLLHVKLFLMLWMQMETDMLCSEN